MQVRSFQLSSESTTHLTHRPEFLIGDQLVYMFSAACKYQVLGLMAICEKQMEHNLNVANAAHYLAAADQIGARSLKMACLRFIGELLLQVPLLTSRHSVAAHSSDVVASEGYRDLDSRLCRMILGK
jgi:predicted RNA-binding protein with PUA-like domain